MSSVLSDEEFEARVAADASDREKRLLRILDAARADAKSWKHEWEMYANAWERELGPIGYRKRHRIDALVEATRRQKEEWFALRETDRIRRLNIALASRDECEASIRAAADAHN